MPFLITYWKQIASFLAILVFIGLVHHRGYVAGEASVQARWDAQKVLDLQAVDKAEAKTDTINLNSEKVTQDENTKLNTSDIATTDYYSSHPVPIPNNRMQQSTVRETSSSEVSSVSTATEQPNQNTTDTIPRADYEALANDCLATTIQLDNAQEWAKEQAQVNAE